MLLASARFVGRGENTQLLALLAQLAALSDAVTRLRETQDRAAQAAAARGAAEQLRLSAAQRTSPRGGPPAATATAGPHPPGRGVLRRRPDPTRTHPRAGRAAPRT